jgi:hypothetical protein
MISNRQLTETGDEAAVHTLFNQSLKKNELDSSYVCSLKPACIY